MRVQPSLKLSKKKGSRLKESRRHGVCFLCGDAGGFAAAYSGIKTDAGTFGIEVCRGCGLKRTEPFLDEAELGRLYSHSSYREEDATRFFSPLEWVIDRLRSRQCAVVERFSLKAGSVLDVGCGRGDFLSRMAARGWKATGLELDRRVVNRARQMGLNPFKGLDLRVGELVGPATAVGADFPDGQFDVVTFNHVFEHVRDPVATLRECVRILKPGGLLLIAVPNAASLQARVTGKHWFHLDPPFHLYHYSLKTLKGLLNKAGAGNSAVFEVVSVSNFSLEYNPYGWLQSVYNLCGFPRNLLYDFLRGKAGTAFYTRFCLFLTFMTLPLFALLSMALSILEAVIGMGGTIEVYARKKK